MSHNHRTKITMKPPKKLDITKFEFPNAADLADKTQNSSACRPTIMRQEPSAYAAEVTMLSKALVAVANQTWRIAGAVIDPDSKEPKSELSTQEIKKVGNAFDSIKETLGELGLKIIDRFGEPFNTGLPEQVVTEEPREGISKEQIIRTIRPTIMWHQTMVQRGEIDIVVPIAKK